MAARRDLDSVAVAGVHGHDVAVRCHYHAEGLVQAPVLRDGRTSVRGGHSVGCVPDDRDPIVERVSDVEVLATQAETGRPDYQRVGVGPFGEAPTDDSLGTHLGGRAVQAGKVPSES